MNRGDIHTAATGHGSGGTPRPVLIVQADAFAAPSKTLRAAAEIMIDTILPVRATRFGVRVGRLSTVDMRRVEISRLAFLGITLAG